MNAQTISLHPVTTWDLKTPIGQCRAVPVQIGAGPPFLLTATAADFDVDPYIEMFFFPQDTLKLTLLTPDGGIRWQKDLGPGVVPGVWFCPIFPFDLDGDGAEEIWLVTNENVDHPLGLSGYRLEALDPRTGESLGRWPWPTPPRIQPLSWLFRNFILGGTVGERPVLVTAQGTYADMFLQAWNPDLSLRWEVRIGRDDPGARGSHMCPLVDFDEDGVQAVLWGERCLSLDDGSERFCADRDRYRGHSDVVQPLRNPETGNWYFFTCRESDPKARPRVVLFDASGERVWGDLDQGHIDMGWVAHTPNGPIACAIRIGSKTAGPDGRFHQQVEPFCYAARTGEPIPPPVPLYRTLPVDLNGDGFHEFVRGMPGGDGQVFDATGRPAGRIQGTVAFVGKCSDRPGEQILAARADGQIQLWADRNAEDSPLAQRRYEHPIYRANRRLTAVGYHLSVLSGIA